MPYGMQIRTVNGLENIENLRSLREVYRELKTSPSGSQFISGGATQLNSAVFFDINDGKAPPLISWSGSTVSWAEWGFFDTSSNFFLIVCRFK